ncbi:hypothetical protein DNTS_026734 [Danionella cerebrum]|uniref:Uncharacterized protein n=1 Tax=Danionella cerebrum TaxID=2873325 RepID=A0A553RL06_9TELE|nr:hypothetical protein DNTS_026734 [Danionella translucida]
MDRMGDSFSTVEEHIAINKKINQLLKEDKKVIQSQCKILLLGTGDSGKSTFLKQLRMIHGGFSEEQRRLYAKVIHQEIFKAMSRIMSGMRVENSPCANPKNKIYSQMFNYQHIDKLNEKHIRAIHHLLADEAFKHCTEDSEKYFFKNLDRITTEDYIPSFQDILHIQSPTTGIFEYSFEAQNITFRFFDVGGKKSERRKWIHCFENVSAIIYIASLSEYDENRMRESVALFDTVVHFPFFAECKIILFLNKTDKLTEKIQSSDLKTYFPEFEGRRQNAQDAMLFIRKLYQDKALCQETNIPRNVFCQYICAINTTNVIELFNDVKDIICEQHLKEYKTL